MEALDGTIRAQDTVPPGERLPLLQRLSRQQRGKTGLP